MDQQPDQQNQNNNRPVYNRNQPQPPKPDHTGLIIFSIIGAIIGIPIVIGIVFGVIAELK